MVSSAPEFTGQDGLMDLETFKELYLTSPATSNASTKSPGRKVEITQIRNPKVLPGGRYMLTSLEIRNESTVSGFEVIAVEYGLLSFEVSWSQYRPLVTKTLAWLKVHSLGL